MIDTIAVYTRDIAHDLLTADDELELGRAARAGDLDARAELVRCNLRLVIAIASKFQGRGLPLEDLIAEGNLGLMKAAERFDPARGCRFSTYATWWIRQAVSRAVIERGGRLIRLPCWIVEQRRKIARGEPAATKHLTLARAADAASTIFSLDTPPRGEGRNVARYDATDPGEGPVDGGRAPRGPRAVAGGAGAPA